MAKTASIKGTATKSKKADETPVDQTTPVWMQDQILKKIGEQAKDWDETPTARELKAEAATKARTPKIETPLLRPPTAFPKWSTPIALALMAMFVMQLAWLSWRTVELTRSLEDLNANVKELAAKVATWSDAETPAQR